MYIINHYFKLHLLTLLILSTLTLAVSNDFSTAEPPLFIDVMAPPINITAPFTDITAPLPINVTAFFMNVITPFINAIAPSTKATAAVNYSRDLVTLAKMYTEESKYNKKDNNFNRKLIIFNDLCNRVGIPQEAKIKGFLIMLHSITLDFYYGNKVTYITFNSICNAIHNYFKGLEYKHKILIK